MSGVYRGFAEYFDKLWVNIPGLKQAREAPRGINGTDRFGHRARLLRLFPVLSPLRLGEAQRQKPAISGLSGAKR